MATYKNAAKVKHNCYCAFCRSPRRIYKKRNIGILNILFSALAAALTMYAFWREVDPRALVIFAVYLGFTETFIQIRWRLSMACRQCGFDPVMYVKDPEKAAAKVKIHLDLRRQDPKYLLAKPLNLPTIAPEKALALQNKAAGKGKTGSLVSRQA